MAGILDYLFGRKPTPAREFERRVFAVVLRHIVDRRTVAKELEEAQNLVASGIPEEQRQRSAARLYLFLENYIAREQPRSRVPADTLRERILNECHPERADGHLALIFLSSKERQVKLFEFFAEDIFKRIPNLIEEGDRREVFRSLEADGQIADVVKEGVFSREALSRKIRKLSPAEQAAFVQSLLARAFAMLTQKISGVVGELRTELMFKNAYRELRDKLSYIEDVPKVLLLVPGAFLEEERVGLMEKSELEEELSRRQRAFESTVAELHGEKVKLSSLSREELEKKVEERTVELVNALRDVKANRAELEEAKGKDEAFLENISDGLVAVDPKWNILLWNRAASEISGWSRESVLGKSLPNSVKFVRESDGSKDRPFLEDAMIFGKTRKTQGGAILIKKDGNKVVVHVSTSPIFDESGSVTSTIIVFRDISNERELQKTREEFGSLATHELRTPVAVIKGYVNLLATGSVGPLTDKQKEYVEQIRRSNERLLDLINAMLNVSRIELGTLAIEPKPTYLPDIAEGVLSELSPGIKEKKLDVKTNYDRYVPIIDVDPSLMHAVFQNLLSNAIKYTPSGGKISLTVRKQKQESDVLVTVTDTGYGIPKDQQSKIFSRLFRADNARAKVPEGTGLGLYIVKSILDQCDGKIWFESEENKGTTFSFTIPLEGMTQREGVKGLS